MTWSQSEIPHAERRILLYASCGKRGILDIRGRKTYNVLIRKLKLENRDKGVIKTERSHFNLKLTACRATEVGMLTAVDLERSKISFPECVSRTAMSSPNAVMREQMEMESSRRTPCCRKDKRGAELTKISYLCRPDACGAHIIGMLHLLAPCDAPRVLRLQQAPHLSHDID